MGLFSRNKRSRDEIRLRGFPGHVETCSCLYMAAEKSLPVQTELLDMAAGEHRDEAFLRLSPFTKIPCLQEGAMVVSGAAAIIPYLDIRGGVQSLAPRKAARLGEQNYWTHVFRSRLLPAVNTLLDESVLKSLQDPAYQPDQSAMDAARKELEEVFSVADAHLADRRFFASDYSYAEIHWAPAVHFSVLAGGADLLEGHRNLDRWFAEIRERRGRTASTCAVLPDIKQIRGKELRNVA